MQTPFRTSFAVLALALVLATTTTACIDHRPIRNGLTDESVYLDKSELTRANPKLGKGATDNGWLMRVTTVATSAPNLLSDYTFVGYESDVKYVKFRFGENSMQVLDGRSFQGDDPASADDDLATTVPRVMLEFAGRNVDVKLQESLDGERTNYVEENTEQPWEKRQTFKVDFEASTLDPISQFGWFFSDLVRDCVHQLSVTQVPGSYEFDKKDQYLSFVLEVTYAVNINAQYGACYSMFSANADVGTTSVRYRVSFYRRGPSSYVPEEIAEKDPVNKKYGAFQVMNLFRDPVSGLAGASSLLKRWDPASDEPITFYFARGFPESLKWLFEGALTRHTNEVFAAAGSPRRVEFKNFDDGGVERELGDLRYSFVAWHQNVDTQPYGLLGYGPSSADPRTGEVFSANLNLYNYGFDILRFFIEDYLETNAGAGKPDPTKRWDEIACTTPGLRYEIDPSARLSSTLFGEIARTMELPEPGPNDAPEARFVPTPQRSEPAFVADYVRMLPEYRYVEPAWNAYVWSRSRPQLVADLKEKLAQQREFQAVLDDILLNENPFGTRALYGRDGIEAMNDFADQMRAWRKNTAEIESARAFLMGHECLYTLSLADATRAVGGATRMCTAARTYESDEAYKARLIERMIYKTAIHEFGHNLALRHNFYGSVDAAHMKDNEVSASVMDYVSPEYEIATSTDWGGYDVAALKWIYGTPAVRAEVMSENFLYCTDEHRFRSPLCQASDLGITPSQIVLNAIEDYDWMYEFRNRRAYRTFWNTTAYPGAVYNSIFPLLRFWYLSIFDWGGGGVQSTLKRLDQVDPTRTVLTEQEYDEVAADFYNDARAAIGMTMAFYDAVINQPASFRNYQTEFDPFYGDVLRLGIIIDKLFTTFAFMDLQEVYDYNPNINTYVAMYDAPFGQRNAAISQRVLDNMLGASYDTFPWFRYLALNIFAAVTNSNLIGNTDLKERIAIRRFNNREDLEAEFGSAVVADATRANNPSQVFVHDGEEMAYTFLPERGWHLVAGRSRSPVSFQFMKDYNESMNSSASEDEDTYGLKVLLAYYEYYNNFTGY